MEIEDALIDLSNKLFDVEHALLMHANSFVVLPAAGIYEHEVLKQFEEVTKKCHIYLIGQSPKIVIDAISQKGRNVVVSITAGDVALEIASSMPEGARLVNDDGNFYLEDEAGRKYAPNDLDVGLAVKRKTPINFEVLYIGQAYGEGGSRNSIDRLLKHETLQRIALQGTPVDKVLNILLLEISPSNGMYTLFNPRAIHKDEDGGRISAGLEKLRNTSEKERVALFEASLIRYFQPKYNKEFKNSFPSTTMKVLKDCYEKDFSAIVAEINFDELPWDLMSSVVAPQRAHIVKHNLHTAAERSLFFLSGKPFDRGSAA